MTKSSEHMSRFEGVYQKYCCLQNVKESLMGWKTQKLINLVDSLPGKTCVACLLLFFEIFKVVSNRKWTCRRFKTALHDTVLHTDALCQISGSWLVWFPRKMWQKFFVTPTTQDDRSDPYMSPPLKRAGDTTIQTHTTQNMLSWWFEKMPMGRIAHLRNSSNQYAHLRKVWLYLNTDLEKKVHNLVFENWKVLYMYKCK